MHFKHEKIKLCNLKYLRQIKQSK